MPAWGCSQPALPIGGAIDRFDRPNPLSCFRSIRLVSVRIPKGFLSIIDQ